MTSAPSPLPPQGPRHAHIQWLWAEVWKQHSEGAHWGYYATVAEAEIKNYRETLPPNDALAATDFKVAEHHHVSHREQFGAYLRVREDEQRKISQLREAIFSQNMKVGMFVVQSLALANGSAVLGTLSYLGSGGTTGRGWMLAVAGFGSLGFILTLAAAHIASLMTAKPIDLLMDMSAPYIPQAALVEKGEEMRAAGKKILRITRPLGYGAALCLVLAILCGLTGLYPSSAPKNSVPPPPIAIDTLPAP